MNPLFATKHLLITGKKDMGLNHDTWVCFAHGQKSLPTGYLKKEAIALCLQTFVLAICV